MCFFPFAYRGFHAERQVPQKLVNAGPDNSVPHADEVAKLVKRTGISVYAYVGRAWEPRNVRISRDGRHLRVSSEMGSGPDGAGRAGAQQTATRRRDPKRNQPVKSRTHRSQNHRTRVSTACEGLERLRPLSRFSPSQPVLGWFGPS